VPESLLEEINSVLTWPATHEQVEAAARLVPDEIVQLLTAPGARRSAGRKVGEYGQPGLHLPGAVPARQGRPGDDRHVLRLDRLSRPPSVKAGRTAGGPAPCAGADLVSVGRGGRPPAEDDLPPTVTSSGARRR